MKSSGMVYLVGAGPGDVGLLTVRGADLLGQAEVVIYDALVNPDLLRLAPSTAEVVFVGKRSRHHTLPQEELYQLLVRKAKEGKRVVRLKGGDPYIFGRGGEEAQELADAGVPFEVVPGITSAIAVPAYAGIPLTHRDHCSSFHVFTGHEDPTRPESRLDWSLIARLSGTRVILMGMERLRSIAEVMLQEGADSSTPVGLIRWGTTGRQKTLTGTLATIADLAEKAGFEAPAVVVIGGVVGMRKKLDWFERRPLFGQRIVVTRTRDQASQLRVQLQDQGADVLEIPTIKVTPPDQVGPLIESMASLGEYDWLVFTSPNGVTTFFEYFFKAFEDVRSLGFLRIAAVGPATAAKLKELHLNVDAMPEEYVARKICSAIGELETLENLRILCLRAQVAQPDLVQELENKGAIVDDVACYQTVAETEDHDGAAARLLEEGAEWVTFTSASTVENFNVRFKLKDLKARWPQIRFATIGPETTKALMALGFNPDVEAKPHTLEGMVKAILKA